MNNNANTMVLLGCPGLYKCIRKDKYERYITNAHDFICIDADNHDDAMIAIQHNFPTMEIEDRASA
jgi:hypothetical protein